MTEVWSVDDPAQIGLCGGRTLVRTRRQFEHVSGPKKGQRSKVETVYHVSSVPIDEGHGVEHFADAVRGQWAIESMCPAVFSGSMVLPQVWPAVASDELNLIVVPSLTETQPLLDELRL